MVAARASVLLLLFLALGLSAAVLLLGQMQMTFPPAEFAWPIQVGDLTQYSASKPS